MNEIDAIARRLVEAYRQRNRIAVTPESGPVDAEQAYAVQRAVWRMLVGDSRPSAWKVGAAAPDAPPFAAPVLPSRLAWGPVHLSAGLFTGLGVEAEIALRFARDLPARPEPYDRTEILAAIGSAHVAMELVDTRLADAEAAGPYWRLADNQVNGALVLGDAIADWRAADWSECAVRITADDREVATGTGRPPLGDILHCLPWWLAHVGGARAGDIVTTGAWTGMHPVAGAMELRAMFEGLGQAAVRLA
ncbi:MAG: hydratase [Thiobacillus sp.]|nr:hydratase [Thiobacillus sp.]